jgi:proline racemase
MRVTRSHAAIEVHAEGEQGTCYLGSIFEIPGRTAREKLHHVNTVDDTVRRLLTLEPRGRPQASANLVFPSTDPRADAGFVVLQADRAHAMSGSNTICVVTALLETGTVTMTEPTTVVTLETAAGLVRTEATCRDGRCERVTFAGVPAFVEALDVPLAVPGLGTVPVDVAYGGCFYVLVDGAAVGVRVVRDEARTLVERAEAVMAAARRQLKVRHPDVPEIDFLSYVMVTGDDDPAAGLLRGATVLSGRVDRSPCGTGTSARLACLAARGLARPGSTFTARSLIDSEFVASISGTTTVGARAAVLPTISGRGWIVGTRTTTVDPTDPFAAGFALPDLWGTGLTTS